MKPRPTAVQLSGERFEAVYHLSGTASEAESVARALCVEQTVEYPLALIDRRDILEGVVARVVSLSPLADDFHEAVISFAVEVVGCELTQLLNVLFGNISLLPGIRLVDVRLSTSLLAQFAGPAFGRDGLRELLGVAERPLLATALKPMGLSVVELAEIAGQCATGGIDIIKDDHGLTDQLFCPFAERVKRCANAVRDASDRSGRRSLYFANATAPANQLAERVGIAREAGAGGVLIAPGLTGFDAMAAIARDEELDMPILGHPALLGSYTISPRAGIAHGVIYGLLSRIAGADVSIFPHAGGRFTFTDNDCRAIAQGCTRPLNGVRPILPAPAGGMRIDRVADMVRFYGRDVVLLIGGDLHRHGGSLVESCQRFLDLVS